MPPNRVPRITYAQDLVEILRHIDRNLRPTRPTNAKEVQERLLQEHLKDRRVHITISNEDGSAEEPYDSIADGGVLRDALRYVIRQHKRSGVKWNGKKGVKDVNDLFKLGTWSTFEPAYLRSIGWPTPVQIHVPAREPAVDRQLKPKQDVPRLAVSSLNATTEAQNDDGSSFATKKRLPSIWVRDHVPADITTHTDLQPTSGPKKRKTVHDEPSPAYSPLTPVDCSAAARRIASAEEVASPPAVSSVSQSQARIAHNQLFIQHREQTSAAGLQDSCQLVIEDHQNVAAVAENDEATTSASMADEDQVSATKTQKRERRSSIEVRMDPSGILPLPELTPTQMPVHKHERALDPGGDWVKEDMTKVSSAIGAAVNAYIQQHEIDPVAAASFCINPPAELGELYSAMFGTKSWKACIVAAHWQQPSVGIMSKNVLKALIGAEIHYKVFIAPAPEWSYPERLVEAFGERGREDGEAAMVALGYDLDTLLGLMSRKQIQDPKFCDTVVAGHASELAYTLVMTLQPHMQRLAKLTVTRAEKAQEEAWFDSLTEAFQRAIIMKQKMAYSDAAKYQATWYEAGSPFDPKLQCTNGKPPGDAVIGLTTLSGISKETPRGDAAAQKTGVAVKAVIAMMPKSRPEQ